MATRTISNGGGNFSSIGTWVEGAVPVAGDAVVATGTSGQLTVDVASGGVGLLSFIMTGYVGTLTMNNTLTVSGNVTLVAGMTIAGTSDLIVNSTATLTSSGKTWTGGLQLRGTNITYTLADSWIISGTLTVNLAGTGVLNGAFNISVAGGLTVTTGILNGTASIIMNGTGTWSGAGTLKPNLTFNTAGTITVSGTVFYGVGTLTYTAGTMIVTGSTLDLHLAATVNIAGTTWNNVSFTGSTATYTLLSDINMTGTCSLSCAGFGVINGLFNINVGGGLVSGSASSSGTSTIIMNGTGTFSGTGTIQQKLTFNTAGTITVSGAVLFNTGAIVTYIAGTMIVTGSTLSVVGGSATFNTSGMSWQNMSVTSSSTTTLTSNLNLSGNLTFNNSIINGLFSVNIGGSLTVTTGASGTSSIVMNGTGTWSGTGLLVNNLTFNTAGTITVSGTVFYGVGTLTYTAGTIVTTSSTLALTGATVNTSSVNWNNITISSGTQTLSSNLNILGNLLISGGSTINGAFNVNVGGNVTTTGNLSGNTTIVMNGTGTWSGAGFMLPNLTFNTAGTITVSGTVLYQSGTLTYTAGTITTTSSTLSINGATTLNTAGMSWNNILLNAGTGTLTINSLLSVTGTLTNSGNVIFAGSDVFTAANFTDITAGNNLTFLINKTYTVTTGLTLAGTLASPIIFKSSSATTKTIFTLNNSATQDVSFVTATDIDSSLGKTVWDYKGTLLRTLNWNLLTNPITIAFAYLTN